MTRPRSPEPNRPARLQLPFEAQSDGSRLRAARPGSNGRAAAFRHPPRGAFPGEGRLAGSGIPPVSVTPTPNPAVEGWLSPRFPRMLRISPCCRANSYLEAASMAWCSRPRHSYQRAGGDSRRDYSVRGTRGARGRAGVTVPARAAAAAAA